MDDADGAGTAGQWDNWLVDSELADPAFAEVVADGTLQTRFPDLPPPPVTPNWLASALDSLFRFFDTSGPVLRIVLIALAAVLAVYLLVRLVQAVRRRFTDGADAEADENAVGAAESRAARSLLDQAEDRAAAGDFAGAVHLLLLGGVDDIARREPGLVRPSVTARDLAAATPLAAPVRTAFARLTNAVEISLFGGRNIDAAVWDSCRDAYRVLTIPASWRAT